MKKLPLIWLLAAVCLTACDSRDKVMFPESSSVAEGEDVALPFSFSVGTVKPATKMTPGVTQAAADEASFRGIKEIYALPFRATRAVSGTDRRIGPNLLLPQRGIPGSFGESAQEGDFAGLVRSNNAHLYKNVYMRRGTASMLVYGEAIDESVSVAVDSVDFKRRNGVLRSRGLQDAEYAAGVTFTLEPYITSANSAEFQNAITGIQAYLNDIASAQVSLTGYTSRSRTQTTWTYRWRTAEDYSNHAALSNAFSFLTADGLAFSGGSDGIGQMLTTLYNNLYALAYSEDESDTYYQTYYGYYSYYSSGDYYYVYELAREIRSRIDNSTYVTLTGTGTSVTVALKDEYADFPARFGVPSGSVAFQWNGTAFAQRTPATGSAMAPVDAYCYPPSLWYWTNSTLKTTDNESVVQEYRSIHATWADIFGLYTYSSSVIPGAVSAALKEPLQYGVAMLEVNLRNAVSPGGTQFLLDSKGNTVDVRNDNYPLTGIVVGEQKNQEYDFTPLMEGMSSYVYDSDVMDGSTPRAYIAGASAGLTFKPVYTLLVQTEDAQDVHLALEFRNDSGAAFYGVNGCQIAPGAHFYLLATLKYASASNTTGAPLPAVFVHDHTTKVTLGINSLAKAYNTIPELRDPQLEIGVVAQIEWIQVIPSEVPLY